MWEERQGPWENAVVGRHRRRHLQVHRRRHDVEAADQRACRTVVQANLAISPAQSERLYASSPASDAPGCSTDARRRRHLPQRRRGRDAGRASRPTRGRAAASAAAICRCRCRDPKNPDIVIMASTVVVEVHRRRQDAGRRSRARPAATTIRTAGSIRTIPTSCSSPPTRAPSSRSTAAQTWSSWYNQPTAQLYHVTADNAFPVPRLQRTAGERVRVRVEPRQLRRDLASRLDAGRRRRIRLRRARSARSRHRLRRPQRHPLRPADRTGLSRRTARPVAAARREQPALSARSGRCRSCSPKSTSARCSSPTTISGRRSMAARRWPQISPDLTRKTWDDAEERGQISAAARGDSRTQRGVIYTVAPSYQDINAHLGRHRRRAHPRDGRRRHDLEGRDAAADWPVGQGVASSTPGASTR